MATVVKRGKQWTAVFRDHSGKQQWVKTDLQDKKAAKQKAQALEAVAKLDPGLTEAEIVLRLQNAFNEALAAHGLPLRLIEVGHGAKRVPPFREFADQWLSERPTRSRGNHTSAIDRFEEWCQKNGVTLDLDTVEPSDISRFRDHCRDLGLSTARVNHHLKVLRSVWKRAVEFDIVAKNPAMPVKTLEPDEQKDDQFAEPLTEQQFAAMLQATSDIVDDENFPAWDKDLADDWRTFLLIAGRIGSRMSDTRAMTWDRVDLEAGGIDYLPSKTRRSSKKRVLFPLKLAPDLWQHLWALNPDGKAEGLIMPRLATENGPGKGGVADQFKDLLKVAGVEVTRVERQGAGRSRYSHTCQSLRHTAVTNAIEMGLPREVAMALFGHSTRQMSEHYTHWSNEALDAAVTKALAEKQSA